MTRALINVQERLKEQREHAAVIFMRDGPGAVALHDLGVGQVAFWQLCAKHEHKHERIKR